MIKSAAVVQIKRSFARSAGGILYFLARVTSSIIVSVSLLMVRDLYSSVFPVSSGLLRDCEKLEGKMKRFGKKLLYRGYSESNHWHLGIVFSDNETFDKILDLTFIGLGAFYWQKLPSDPDRFDFGH